MTRPSTMILATLLAAILAVTPTAARASAATPSQTATWQTVVAIHHPTALAIDTRGDPRHSKWAYVVDDSRHVVKFGTGGRILGSWLYRPQTRYNLGAGIAVGGSGNVFVADASTGRVVKFDPSG